MIALIVGNQDKIGLEMASSLLGQGWQVYMTTGLLPPENILIDLLILNVDEKPQNDDRTITDGLPYDEMRRAYKANALDTLRAVARYLPMLGDGGMKRVALVNAVQSSNYAATGISGYAYAMSKAALNMMINIFMNRYRPEGYTFRVFCLDGCVENEGACAVQYFLTDRSYEPDDLKHSDENRLVMRNAVEREYSW